MGQAPYSDDLRSRVVAEWTDGASCRAAAQRFRVSASSAIRWVARHRRTGSAKAPPRGGQSRSPLEAHAAWLQALLAREPDLTLAQIAARIAGELDLRTSTSAVDRFCGRHKLTFKKNPARCRTGPSRRGPGAPDLADAPSPLRPASAGLHR